MILTAAAASADAETSVWVILLIAVISSSALAAGLTGWLNRRKISSEAENIQAQTSDFVWKRVNGELERMQQEINDLRAELAASNRRVVNAERRADSAERRADQAEVAAWQLHEYIRAYAGRVAYLEQQLRAAQIPFEQWEPPRLPDMKEPGLREIYDPE